ncbi:cytochrome b (mitochondrion) [Nakaseomyces glabratus]|uniref:Cytochrome b n=1 Tax=Candida glabrata TaxID=5478 RepID=A0A0W0C697_CANGB|nr:cytochrome b [Nakaseomyces glabratus]KTA94970.1 cytochrome b [Nakaseomyces glabratus]KTA94985.1 cytochrome b [Nakaseomyces glabratus]KTA94988.1 cytochrome b [Nakaseomyces glabratus]KTB10741.1 cytochrome b [Nakaseomyces glabratus]
MHANGASFFFICMYMHIAKGLYYGSYRSPRVTTFTSLVKMLYNDYEEVSQYTITTFKDSLTYII